MNSTLLRCVLMCLLVSAMPQAAHAQEVIDTSPPTEYQIGPGDMLSIQVSGVREFDLQPRVSNSGRIHVPYVGIMLVGGMTVVELEGEIAKKIEAHELVNQPQVRVQIDQHHARPVYVIGEVNNPGQFVITSEMYLLDLISKAGGLLPSADEKGYLYRRSASHPSVQTRLLDPAAVGTGAPQSVVTGPDPQAPAESNEDVTVVDFELLRSGTQPELNKRLEGGDVVVIPRRVQRFFFVIGDVIAPGPYTLPRRGELTVSQAMIYSGGTTPTAKQGAAFIMRQDAGGGHQAVEFNFSKIIQGEEPDFPIRENDILYVPTSAAKIVGQSLLLLVPRLLQQYLIF